MEVTEIVTAGGLMPAPATEGCLTLSGIPPEVLDTVASIAADRSQSLKEIYTDIANDFIASIKAGEQPKFESTYRGSVRKNVWVDLDVFEEVNGLAKQLGRSKSSFMLTAIQRFLTAHGK